MDDQKEPILHEVAQHTFRRVKAYKGCCRDSHHRTFNEKVKVIAHIASRRGIGAGLNWKEIAHEKTSNERRGMSYENFEIYCVLKRAYGTEWSVEKESCRRGGMRRMRCKMRKGL